MSLTKPSLLFVYGTLMQGQRNHRYLEGARFLGSVRTEARYTLVSLGSFPALRAQGSASVAGELYSVGPSILAALDVLEGHPEFYRRGFVQLEDGRSVTSYLLPPQHHPQSHSINAWPERHDSGD